jgi:hypothetical protein
MVVTPSERNGVVYKTLMRCILPARYYVSVAARGAAARLSLLTARFNDVVCATGPASRSGTRNHRNEVDDGSKNTGLENPYHHQSTTTPKSWVPYLAALATVSLCTNYTPLRTSSDIQMLALILGNIYLVLIFPARTTVSCLLLRLTSSSWISWSLYIFLTEFLDSSHVVDSGLRTFCFSEHFFMDGAMCRGFVTLVAISDGHAILQSCIRYLALVLSISMVWKSRGRSWGQRVVGTMVLSLAG